MNEMVEVLELKAMNDFIIVITATIKRVPQGRVLHGF
jgi:hypothetical protein